MCVQAAKARRAQVPNYEDDEELHSGGFDLIPAQTGGTLSMSSDTPSADLDGTWDSVPFEVRP